MNYDENNIDPDKKIEKINILNLILILLCIAYDTTLDNKWLVFTSHLEFSCIRVKENQLTAICSTSDFFSSAAFKGRLIFKIPSLFSAVILVWSTEGASFKANV